MTHTFLACGQCLTVFLGDEAYHLVVIVIWSCSLLEMLTLIRSHEHHF